MTARTAFGPMDVMDETTQSTGPDDPRGRGFRHRVSVDFVRTAIAASVAPVGREEVRLLDAHGRVLAEPVVAATPVPHFARAAMDGYALIAAETVGASQLAPACFTVIGRSRPGRRFPGQVRAGQAVEIATGAPMPEGTDAVVPVEFAEIAHDRLTVIASTAPGKHVGQVAEDIAPGDTVLSPGRCLRPQDLGILSALGHGSVTVIRQPRIAMAVTGDELLSAGSRPAGFAFADMNSPMLSALIRRDGGVPVVIGPLADDPARLKGLLRELAGDPSIDAVFVNGGSSTGPEDHAPSLVRELGSLLVHGVALRPAGPTGFGLIGAKPVLLLPGNPVSCLCAYDFFGGLIVRSLGGRPGAMPYPIARLRLARPIDSAAGRVDYVRVRAQNGDAVEPITSAGASKLSTATQAAGFVIVPEESPGIAEGILVDVHLYDMF